MSKTGRWLFALGAALAVMMLFSWPVPRYFATGIASSSSNVEKDSMRRMIPGDHLQLLYHFWLARDVFSGRTPLFHNLYEFNTGDDNERYSRTTYYLPFSAFFAAGSLLGGQAVGWNVAVLLSLLLNYRFSLLLVRRYQPDAGLAALLALIPLVLPYVWLTLLGGSPTGFAMMWVPIVLYGIDRWVVSRSLAGATLGGAAVYFSGWSDQHVFFFCALLAPCWAVVAYVYHCGWQVPTRDQWVGWLKASWLLVLFGAFIAVRALKVHSGLQDTAIASGRSLHEIALFSHGMADLVGLNPNGDAGKIYLGYYGLALLCAGALYLLNFVVRRRADRRIVAALLLAVGIGGLLLLSMGVKSPFGPRFWRAVTTAIPPYGMIRQPDKIFCILPVLVMMAATLISCLASAKIAPAKLRAGLLVLLVPLALDYQARLSPTVCILDTDQAAYAAIAEDARRKDLVPRALALPLWPGDSHLSSLYQFYGSRYRIRMVNGYRPTARQAYVDDIFTPLNSMTLGHPSNEQLDSLLSRGVYYLVLHEDAFPEKVSSFPVGVTLENLRGHPRLKQIGREGPVWSFAIRPNGGGDEQLHAAESAVSVCFPVRTWNWESGEWPEEWILEEETAIGGRYAAGRAPMDVPVAARHIRTAGPRAMEWHLRARGAGLLALDMTNGDGIEKVEMQQVQTNTWTWLKIAAPPGSGLQEHRVQAMVQNGSVDLDAMILTSKGWRSPPIGESLTIPASAFFRAGYTRDDMHSVALRSEYDPGDVIFYSRNLYLEPGGYEVSLVFESDADDGVSLGRIFMNAGRRYANETSADVVTGRPATMIYRHPANVYFKFGFDYTRAADMQISAVIIKRIS